MQTKLLTVTRKQFVFNQYELEMMATATLKERGEIPGNDYSTTGRWGVDAKGVRTLTVESDGDAVEQPEPVDAKASA